MKPKYWNKGKIYLSNKDKVLKKLIQTYRNEYLNLNSNYFHSLINSIIGQQISVSAADSMKTKFFKLKRSITPQTVSKLSTTDLRKCGLSRQKILYIRNISKFFLQNFIVADNSNENIEKNIPEKGPLNFIVGSLTSFLLFIFFYFLSNKIAIYFSVHKPSNSSEIVQNISSSINTLIIGLSFLLTFSFAFIGIGLFIVFIRSFFLKKN